MDLDRKAMELKEARTPFCWATVVKAEGSAPRHAGAKMIVTRDETFGTVGGGGVEHEASNWTSKGISPVAVSGKILKQASGKWIHVATHISVPSKPPGRSVA